MLAHNKPFCNYGIQKVADQMLQATTIFQT